MANQGAVKFEALAQALAEKAKGSTRLGSQRLRLAAVDAAPDRLFDSITRDSILKRVRFLARTYRLQWQVDQATFDLPGVDTLEDAALSSLLSDMEKARECLAEGVSFEEAGLVRNTADHFA